MGLQLNDITAIINRTTGLVAGSSDYTCCFWYQPTFIAATDYVTAFALTDGGGAAYTKWVGVFSGADHNNYLSVTGEDAPPLSTVIPANTVCHLAYVRSGTTHSFYRDGVLVDTTTADVSTIAFAEAVLGYDGWSLIDSPLRFADWREWNAALTVPQIAVERLSRRAVRTANLWTDTPLATDLLDDSGNAHHWSGAGAYGFVAMTLSTAPPPAFKSVGALGSAVGSPSVLWPTHAPGDLGLLCIETCGGEAVPSTPTGWTPLPNSPQATGAGATGTRLTVFYKFATKSNEFGENPADSGDHNSGLIVVFSGVATAGLPWDVIAGGVKGTASTSVSLPSVTTTVANALIVHIATHDLDIGTAQFSGQTNAALTSLTERADLSSTQGNGGGIAIWTGEKAIAGSIGATTATVGSSVNAMLTIALRPPVPTAGGLPTTSLTAHFDASVTTDLFKTFVSGGPHTGVPVDGDSVVVWDHAERSDRIFKQYTTIPVPVWRATTPLMALPCLDFSAQALRLMDNANNALTLSHLITQSTYTALIAFYAEAITSSPGATIRNGHPLIGDDWQEFGAFLHLSSGVPKVSAYNWPSTSHYVTLDCTVGAVHVLMMRHEGGFLYASLDGGAESSIASGNTPDVSSGYPWLGGQTGTGATLNGRIGELAIYYNALTGAELTAAIAYFTAKWIPAVPLLSVETAPIASNALLYAPHGPGEFIPAPVVEGVQIGKTGANTTTHVLSFPSGTEAGDLLLAWLILDSQQVLSYITNPNLTWPDGWNFSSQNYGSSAPAANYPKHAAYWKIVEPSDFVIPAGSIMVGGYGDEGRCTFLSPDGSITYSQPPSAPNPGSGLSTFCRMSTGNIGQAGGNAPSFPTTGAGVFKSSDLTVLSEYTGTRQDGVCCAADALGYWYTSRLSFGGTAQFTKLNSASVEVATWDIAFTAGLDTNFRGAMAVSGDGLTAYLWMHTAFPDADRLNIRVHKFSLVGAGSYLGLLHPTDFDDHPGYGSLLCVPDGSGDLLVTHNLHGTGYIRRYTPSGAIVWTAGAPATSAVGDFSWMSLALGLPGDTHFLAWAYESGTGTTSDSHYCWFSYATGTPDNTRNFIPDDGAGFEFDSQMVVLAESIAISGGVIVTSAEAQKSAYVMVRVSGYRQGSCPVIAASDTGGWSYDPVTGAIENFLILAFTGWRNGTLTADAAPPFGDLGQINDGDVSQGVGVAVASHSFYGSRPVGNIDWSYSTEGVDGSGRPLPYAQGWIIAILPPTVDDPVPLNVHTVYNQAWPVLKSRAGAFTEEYYERPPLGTGSDVPPVPDPHYPEILSNESSQVALDSMGRHVLTGDWPPSRPNDWVVTGPVLYEIGDEGAPPGDPNAGNGATPIGGWFNTKECRWTFDQQLVTGLWDDAGWANHYMLTSFFGWTIEMDWYVDPDVRPSDYGLPLYSQLSLYYCVHDPQPYDTTRITYMSVDGFPMSRDQWENKRVRIVIEWRCGTITYTPPGSTYVDADDVASIAPDGFIRLSLTDLDTNVTTVAFNIQRIPLYLDGWQNDGEPDINYSCGIALGYASQMGPCERTIVEAFGDAPILPEAVFDPNEAPIGLTWVEFTDSDGTVHVWSNIALPDPITYYYGYKSHRVVEFGPIRRGLSNIDGQYEGIIWSWTVSG